MTLRHSSRRCRAIVILLVFAVFGKAVASVIIFPLLFLFFAVPLGEFLLPLLMEWTAKFTVIAVRLSGVPVYQEGLQFIISSGSWSVVEACSGVRYLISSVMIGTLYAYLNFQSFNRRFIFICFSIIVPVLANWVRAYIIVMLGHFSGNTLAVGFDHLIYGWLFFGVVIMLMFLIGGRWSENIVVNPPIPQKKLIFNPPNNSNFWYVSLMISIFVALPVGWVTLVSNKYSPKIPSLVISDSLKSGWIKTSDQLVNKRPNFDKAVIYVDKYYEKNSAQVGLYVKYYRNQNSDNKLVSPVISVIDSKNNGFIKTGIKDYVVQIPASDFSVKTTDWRSLNFPGRESEVHLKTWQFYWVNGLFTASDYKAKIYGAFQRLLGNGDDSAVIVLYANDAGDDSGNRFIEQFLQDNILEIKDFLEITRAE